MRSTTAILLRKLKGQCVALFRTATLMPASMFSGNVATANELGAARSVVAFLFPFIAVMAVLLAIAYMTDHASAFALAITPLVTPAAKSSKVGELRAEADRIRKIILNGDPATPDRKYSKDEIEKMVNEVAGLEARAAAIAGFTPQDEIDRQGGDAEVRALNPDADVAHDVVKAEKGEMEQVASLVRKHFGGPANYLLMLAKRTKDATLFTAKQTEVFQRVQAFHKRAILGEGGATEGGGEYLLPLQQVASIFNVESQQTGLAQLATRYPVSGRTLRIPALIQDSVAANADGSGSSSVTRPMSSIAAVDIIGEGDEKPERQPRFTQRLLTIYKLAAYTELGDETIADDFTGDLTPVTTKVIGNAIMDRANEYVTTDGTGSAQPLAALHANNTAIKVVNRETSQSITTNDIFNMYAAHTFGNGRSAWLINRTALPKLLALTLGNNTLVTWINGLQGAPTMMLMGLPVFMGDLTAILGVKGDLSLVNGGFYAMALRQALTVESSIHYKFRNDLTAYRFITRFGGIPIPTSTYAYKAPGGVKQAEHSPFVVLGDDVTS